jgi:hypothetical protein
MELAPTMPHPAYRLLDARPMENILRKSDFKFFDGPMWVLPDGIKSRSLKDYPNDFIVFGFKLAFKKTPRSIFKLPLDRDPELKGNKIDRVFHADPLGKRGGKLVVNIAGLGKKEKMCQRQKTRIKLIIARKSKTSRNE